MLPGLQKQLRLDFVSCSIHVTTSRKVDMLIRTAVYHVNVLGLNKYIGLACEPKLNPPIHKAAYKPVICLVLVSYKHDYSASCINNCFYSCLQLTGKEDADKLLS